MTFVDILQPISTTRYEKHVDRGRDAHLGQFEFSPTERIASDKSSPKLFFFLLCFNTILLFFILFISFLHLEFNRQIYFK